eukprot:s1008_g14.t1
MEGSLPDSRLSSEELSMENDVRNSLASGHYHENASDTFSDTIMVTTLHPVLQPTRRPKPLAKEDSLEEMLLGAFGAAWQNVSKQR